MRSERFTRGITLLEVAVAGLLVVVMAAVGGSIYRPLQVGDPPRSACLRYMELTGLGMVMYSTDNGDRLPPARTWMSATNPYLKNWDVFRCPAVSSVNPGAFGRAFSRALGGIDTNKVPNQAAVVSVFDSTLLTRNASSDLGTLPMPPRHPKGNTIAYLDSHAKYLLEPSPSPR